jgi:cellulose synthase (UDP-forming)
MENYPELVLLGTSGHSFDEPKVDIAIPTYNEPPELLAETVRLCQAILYKNKVVWLLDDQRRPAVRQLADSLGCRYLDRESNLGAKAGNLNNALSHMNGDLLAVFDADARPSPYFLRRTVPALKRNPKLAFVQAGMKYYNRDPIDEFIATKQAPATAVPNHELRVRLLSNVWPSDFSVCTGSGFLVRRQALDEIGGFPQQTITEDLHFAVEVQRRGWQSEPIYESLCDLSCPDLVDDLRKQQLRWWKGNMQVLLALKPNPVWSNGLPFKLKLMYAALLIHWLGEATYFAFLFAPLFFLKLAETSLAKYSLALMLACLGLNIGHRWVSSVFREKTFWWSTIFGAMMAFSFFRASMDFARKPLAGTFEVTKKTGTGPSGAISNERLHLGLVVPLATSLLLYGLCGMQVKFDSLLAVDPYGLYGLIVLGWWLWHFVAIGSALCLCLKREIPDAVYASA